MLNKANKWMDGVSFMMLGGHLVLFNIEEMIVKNTHSEQQQKNKIKKE